MHNWHIPQRQSAFGIFMFAGKALREMVALILIITGSILKKEKPFWVWLLLVGSVTVYVFGKAFLEYYFFSFRIDEHQLIIKKGIFSKKTLVIPIEKIQTVQLHQNLLHKLIGHCKVAIDTAGTEKVEVSIHSLAYKHAVELKHILSQEAEVVTDQMESTEQTIGLELSDLFKIAISANHLETIFLIVAFVLARFEDVKDLLGINAYDYLEEHGKEVTLTAQTIGIISFFILAFAMVISVLRIIFKFSDLSIRLTVKGFHLKHGLVSSRQQFIGARKMQYILWKANWIRRRIGLYMFYIKTAGEDDMKRKQRIHVPVTRFSHLQKLAAYYQPDMPSGFSDANFIQKQYALRRILLIGFPITIVAIVIAFIWWEWYALWLLLWLFYFCGVTIVYQKNFRIWANENAIEISRGVWGRENLVLNWSKIQVAVVRQTIYQRKHDLASISFYTASGEISLPYLKLSEARLLADYAAMKTESTQENWM